MKYILAHDLGTSGNKATLFSEEGDLVASCTTGYATNYFNRVWAEQDPEDWWAAVCRSTLSLLEKTRVATGDIAVIALSGQMMGVTCVDREGSPLRPSMIYCDQRSEKETSDLLSRIAMDAAYHIVGHRIAAVYSLEKLLWVKNNQPEIFAKTHKTLCAKDFINFRLTGVFGTDYSDASGTNAFDIRTNSWSSEILDAAQVDVNCFPDAFPSTHLLGKLTSSAAATGLKAGTPVCVGGGDGSCAAVGVGSVRPGTAYNYLGSSAWIGLTTENPVIDPQMRTMTWAHCVPGYFHPTGSVQTAGSAYNWLREQVCKEEAASAEKTGQNVYEVMNALIEQSPPGANGIVFLPYLLGERSPRWNPNARGAFLGITLTTKRSDLVRSVMEGITYNLGLIVDIFRDNITIPIDEVTVIGGGAKGRVWLQMMADVFDVTIKRPNVLEEATSMGAAIVGGVGVGLFSNFDVIDRFLRIDETVEPNRANRRAYQSSKALFDRAYFDLCGLFEDMSRS